MRPLGGQRSTRSGKRGGKFRGQVLEVNAVVVAGHSHKVRLHRREGLQRAQVGGRFNQQTGAAVDQNFGDQIQRLLAAGGDQHMRRVHRPGQGRGHPLPQRRVAFAGGVLQRGAAVFSQDFGAGGGKRVDREGLGRGQATRKADDAGLFRDLQDLADHRGVHFFGASGLGPGHGGGDRCGHLKVLCCCSGCVRAGCGWLVNG